MIATNTPFFNDDRRIDITAYAGPRRAGKRTYNGKYGENPRDDKNGYPSFFTDEVFELYKDAGMNFLMPEADAFFEKNVTKTGFVKEQDFEKSDLYAYMKMAEKHGLDVYPADENIFGVMTHQEGSFGEKEKKIIRHFVETVQKYCPKSFRGIMLTDEPTYHSVGRIKKIMDYLHSDEIKSIKPDIKIYSSMLPMYAPLWSFSPKHSDKTQCREFKFNPEREEAFAEYVEKCAGAIGEFCCDYYPLGIDGWLSPGFYRNLELTAEYGKKGNYPIAITLQSVRMDSGYDPISGRAQKSGCTPTYEDMRFQVYSALAFGVTRIGYFTFWQLFHESTNEMFMKAMVNYEPSEEKGYRVSEIYYAVKEVNEEILAMDHIFLRYKWQGCRVVRKSRDRNIRLVKGDYKDGCVTELTASRDLLLGCFQKEDDGTEGYWIVNAHNPYRLEVNEVELCFEGAERLLYYRKGREYDVPLNNGRFSIRLGVGEGVFAIPYKSSSL